MTVDWDGGQLMVRATSIWSEVAPKRNKDGTTSLVTISPGFGGSGLLVCTTGNRRELILNDAQHEYAFEDIEPAGICLPGGRSRA